MNIVECCMCFEYFNFPNWKEGDVFICKECAEILSEIKKREIKEKTVFSHPFRLALFDLEKEKRGK